MQISSSRSVAPEFFNEQKTREGYGAAASNTLCRQISGTSFEGNTQDEQSFMRICLSTHFVN